MKRNTSFMIILFITAVIGVYMCHIYLSKSKTSNENIVIKNTILSSNLEELINNIDKEEDATTVLTLLTDTLKYINIILEDTPKAKSVEAYYLANKKAITDIYGFNSEEEFFEFYDKIRDIQYLNKYEIISGSVSKTVDNYFFNLKLYGEQEADIPIAVSIQNDSGQIIWMEEKR